MKDGGPGRTRTFDQWIMSPSQSLEGATKALYLSQSSHSDFHAIGLKRTLEDRKGQQPAPLWLHPGVPTPSGLLVFIYIQSVHQYKGLFGVSHYTIII